MVVEPVAKDQPRFWLTNSLWLLMGRAGGQLLGILLTIVVARWLGAEGLGRFTLVLTVVFIGNVFSTFGLDTLLIREVARDSKRAPIGDALAIQMGLSAVFIAGVWLLAPADVTGWGMRIYALSLIPLAVTTVCNAVLRAQERMAVYTAIQVFGAGCRLITVGGLLLAGAGFLPIVWGLFGCQILEMIVTWVGVEGGGTILAPKRVGDSRSLRPLQVGPVFKAGLVLAVLTLVAILYQRIGILLLGWLGDESLTGQFSAAVRLVEAPRMIPYALAGALFPSVARGGATPSARWFGLLAIGFVGLAAAIWPIAPWLINFIFGDGYAPAAFVFQILAWSLVPFVGVLYGSLVLVGRNQERLVMMAHAAALLLALGLGVPFFARWDLAGLAVALVMTELIHAVILLIMVRRIAHEPS